MARTEPPTEGAGRAQCLAAGLTHLGLDVHKDTISVAILAPDHDGPDVERIPHDEASIRRLVGRLGDPRWLRACYEAGPTGYELARLLASMGVRCEVIAPSLIPTAQATGSRPTGGTAGGWLGCTGPEIADILVKVAGRRWTIEEPSTPTRALPAWTSTRSAAGAPGTAGPPW